MEWKKVKGFDYEVSDTGRVRSLDREVPYRIKGLKQKIKGRELKPATKNGYKNVVLHGRDQTKYHCGVHRLVATAFLQKMAGKDVVNHKDFDRTNNNKDNLEWVTQRENHHHSLKHGRCPIGEQCKNAKLTEKQVREIRYSRGGRTIRQLAKEYGVHTSSIVQILSGITWKHV